MANIKGVFSKKNVLVTGGAGFIGSHICEELLKKGESRVICVDNFVSGSEFNIDFFLQNPDFKFLKHDIIEPLDIASFPELKAFDMDVAGIQEIYNCASPTSYKDPKKLPMQTVLTNGRGTKNILDIAKQYKAKMVHLSTSAIYGDPLPEDKHFKEDYWGFIDPVGERASYNEGKRFAETLCSIYKDYEEVDVKIARVFATYGPRMAMAEGRMIPDFIANAIDNKDIVIYGDESSTSSYCYVKDLVDGLFKLINSKESGPLNMGNSEEYALKDIAQKIIDSLGSSSKITYAKPLPEMSQQGLPDLKNAKEKIGWFPLVSLEKGLKETIEYIRSAKSHYEQKGLWETDSAENK